MYLCINKQKLRQELRDEQNKAVEDRNNFDNDKIDKGRIGIRERYERNQGKTKRQRSN